MKSILAPLIALALFNPSALAQSDLVINTPANAVVCEPLLLTWSGGIPPYFLTIVPGNDPSGTPFEDLGEQTGTSVTWLVNLAPGTSIGLHLTDSSGLATAESAPFIINSGNDSSCVGEDTS